jgi:Family of unknown function (DUF6629)
MCFSVEADVTVGLVILPVAVAALREVRHVREVPFAALPLLFALHQLVEAVVWAGAEGQVSAQLQHAAATAYLVFALPVLPILVPTAVLLLEPHGARQRVAPFLALGAVVSAYFGFVLVSEPFTVTPHPYGLEYDTGLQHGNVWALLYITAVIGPSVMSGYRSIIAFGLLNLAGLTVVAILYSETFESLWCVYAACASVLVLVHMVRRRKLPSGHRLEGEPLDVALR